MGLAFARCGKAGLPRRTWKVVLARLASCRLRVYMGSGHLWAHLASCRWRCSGAVGRLGLGCAWGKQRARGGADGVAYVKGSWGVITHEQWQGDSENLGAGCIRLG